MSIVRKNSYAHKKDGTRFCFGLDIIKNVWELCGSDGYTRTVYDYTPCGSVTAKDSAAQPVQWNSERYDAKLAMVEIPFTSSVPCPHNLDMTVDGYTEFFGTIPGAEVSARYSISFGTGSGGISSGWSISVLVGVKVDSMKPKYLYYLIISFPFRLIPNNPSSSCISKYS